MVEGCQVGQANGILRLENHGSHPSRGNGAERRKCGVEPRENHGKAVRSVSRHNAGKFEYYTFPRIPPLTRTSTASSSLVYPQAASDYRLHAVVKGLRCLIL